ncbi:MAG: NADH:flavin oxidoreductase/NADH oxidase family protein [Oceanococcus sp.]
MTTIADTLELPCGVKLPNRLLKSAMTEGLATPLGLATESHTTLYKRWSEGGVGTLVTGNVMVDYRFLERAGNIVVDGNGGEDALARVAEAGTVAGNQLWMQISHPGRQCTRFSNRHPVAPSAIGLELAGMFAKPRVLSGDEIRVLIGKYAHVAKVAKTTGFTGVQIHGAHGYLISQFLSPRTNQRDDEWGGSLENRARLLLETVRTVRQAVGADFPVTVKLNSADFSKNGFSLDDSCQVAQWLEAEGLDLLEISGGTYEDFKLLDGSTRKSGSTLAREAYFIDYAKQIRAAVKTPLAITGGFRSRDVMESALQDNALDVIGIARPTCAMPDAGQRLLADENFRLPEFEANLQVGKGWFGPYSSNSLMKTLNVQGAVSWFYQQIIAAAAGRPVPEKSSLIWAYLHYNWREIRLAIKRSRQLKAAGLSLD